MSPDLSHLWVGSGNETNVYQAIDNDNVNGSGCETVGVRGEMRSFVAAVIAASRLKRGTRGATLSLRLSSNCSVAEGLPTFFDNFGMLGPFIGAIAILYHAGFYA